MEQKDDLKPYYKTIRAMLQARSGIPLNEEYETRIFNTRNISWNCECKKLN